MKPGKLTHTIAVILSSISSLFAHGTEEKTEPVKTKFSKKSDKSADERSTGATSVSFIPGQFFKTRSAAAQRYPWKSNIVTTVFWIGEQAGGNNLVPNRTSCWDKQWTKNYGGSDDPNRAHRSNYIVRKHRALFRGSKRPIKDPPSQLARGDGSPSARVIERLTRNGKTLAHFAPIIGNTCSATNAQSRI